MACTTIEIRGAPQSGKTTVLAGAMWAVAQTAPRNPRARALYVADTEANAQVVQKLRCFPGHVMGRRRFECAEAGIGGYSLVCWDCSEGPGPELRALIESRLNAVRGPTQFLIAANAP